MSTMRILIVSLLGAALVAGCQRSDAAQPPHARPRAAQADTVQSKPAPDAGATKTDTMTNSSQTKAAPQGSDAQVKTQLATFGGGCFWGVEESFRTLKGVLSTRVGYAGGTKDKPSYKDVCTDLTGHAEVVEVTFDPSLISYDQLLDVFFKVHDPTQLNRQGPDYGTQYRSVIFYHSPEQKAAAEAAKKRVGDSGKYRKPVVTQIEAAPTFWAAEDYHQQYLFKRGLSNCHVPG